MIKDQHKTAIWTVEREISYDEMLRRINLCHRQMTARQGDRVVIFSENRPGFIYALFAI